MDPILQPSAIIVYENVDHPASQDIPLFGYTEEIMLLE